jgi:anthranilate synthase component 2
MSQSLLLLDNYDSFTYNLFHLLYTLTGKKPVVMRNTLDDPSVVHQFDGIVLSPGPGLPSEAGRLNEVIAACFEKKPVLGVCLGHQALAEYTGATLVSLPQVYHGVARKGTVVSPCAMYEGMDAEFDAGSYHSWTVQHSNLPDTWQCTAVDAQDEVLSIAHRHLPVWGLQYHPESILTPLGAHIVGNWLKHCF